MGGLEAALAAYELDPPRDLATTLADFLASLGRDWRGWDGEREWESLEGDIRLRARHNGLGTVELRVALYKYEEPSWSAAGILTLDAGALDDLAVAVRRAAG